MLLYMGAFGTVEFLFLIGAAILWLWTLVDAIKGNFKNGSTKILWILAILFIPFFGWVLYLLIGRSHKLTT